MKVFLTILVFYSCNTLAQLKVDQITTLDTLTELASTADIKIENGQIALSNGAKVSKESNPQTLKINSKDGTEILYIKGKEGKEWMGQYAKYKNKPNKTFPLDEIVKGDYPTPSEFIDRITHLKSKDGKTCYSSYYFDVHHQQNLQAVTQCCMSDESIDFSLCPIVTKGVCEFSPEFKNVSKNEINKFYDQYLKSYSAFTDSKSQNISAVLKNNFASTSALFSDSKKADLLSKNIVKHQLIMNNLCNKYFSKTVKETAPTSEENKAVEAN